jgi:hypothetical protein
MNVSVSITDNPTSVSISGPMINIALSNTGPQGPTGPGGITFPYLRPVTVATTTMLVSDTGIGVSYNGTANVDLVASTTSYGVLIADTGGYASEANPISAVPNGSDNINGVNSPATITTPFGSLYLLPVSGGWFVVQ